jgi:HAMP domain-containing protein
MSTNLSLSLIAVLAVSAAGGAARASANPTGSDESGARPSSPTNDEINALETGKPHGVNYMNREIPRRSPTNDEINALETGNPHSVDYGNREIPRRSPTNDEINAAETDDPNSVDNKDRRSASKDLNRPALESAGQDKL